MTTARAGDVDYDAHVHGYAVQRRTDPRIAARVHAAIGEGRSLINVGAGAGSYEPDDRYVVAVEPFAVMRAQRPAHRVPALDAAAERRRFPAVDWIAGRIGTTSRVETVPVPNDCVDGFVEAYYARPEHFLDPRVRASQSAWGFVDDEVERRAVERLRADLDSGAGDARFGHLRGQPEFHGSLRLVVGLP
ncbi:methyltransferase domain-containing protein [Microbispora corallina]|uniref:SAM-dependent methyltransferase n=1 Tax=Microbispora corallina TaxID=83302 RepID=A0ABQ4G105_9ACTN|nr:hypothetical protein [Microbispora corallina]GIH40763.1 hypothetical protein Mco01_37630 [Microbispora corallina]